MTEPSVTATTEAGAAFSPSIGDSSTSTEAAATHIPAQPTLGGAAGAGAKDHRVDLLNNVEMEVTAELGRTRMTVRELLALTPGVVVELDKSAGSPIDLFVNGTLIAHGEVVVIDEEFGVRISAIVGPDAAETA